MSKGITSQSENYAAWYTDVVVKEFENVQVEYQVKEVKETKIIKILE